MTANNAVQLVWAFTFLQNIRSWTTLATWASTHVETHLFMAWSHYKPAREPIYRVVRGKTVHCGYKYIWDTPIIREQQEEGDTYHHNFALSNLLPEWHIWYYIFSPIGPYGLECQGPLTHIPPVEIPAWPKDLYIGTRYKGVFHTQTMSEPGGPQPTWIPVNGGLHSLKIWQMCPDPLAPDRTHFAIAGDEGDRVVYRRQPTKSNDWTPILTNAQACLETGSPSGILCWLTPNINRHGNFFLLFNSGVTENGVWCIRTTDYGKTWHGFQVYDGMFNYKAGNIVSGIGQGASQYDPGEVMYASLCIGAGGRSSLFTSTNHGINWNETASMGAGVQTPRCTIDPTNQKTIYTGAYLFAPNPQELMRSENHGLGITEVDGIYHLGTFILPYKGEMWIHSTLPSWCRILTRGEIWHSIDFCHSWVGPFPTEHLVEHLAILSPHPNNLYLARDQSAPGAPWPEGPHVFSVSTDQGETLHGKSGNHPQEDDGAGDSIPWNSGGVCQQGIMHTVIV